MNHVVVDGRVTADPEDRGDGKPATFSLATYDQRKVGDQWESDASFLDVVAWEHKFGPKNAKAAALALSKGDHVVVSGRLKQDRFERKDGTKGSAVRIIAESVSTLPAEGGNVSKPSSDDPWDNF